MTGLALCEEVVSRSAAVRAGLYARAQALQLLNSSLVCEPIDMAFFAIDGAPPKLPLGVPDAGNNELKNSATNRMLHPTVSFEVIAVLVVAVTS